MGETAFFEVDLATPLGQVRGRVAVDTGPMGLVDLVPTALELTNILVDRARRREEKEGRRISCRAGCGVCCRQMVPLSAPEAFYLADLMDSISANRRKEVLKRFGGIVEELERQNLIDELLDPDYCDDAVLPIAKKYFLLNSNASAAICTAGASYSPADGFQGPSDPSDPRAPLGFRARRFEKGAMAWAGIVSTIHGRGGKDPLSKFPMSSREELDQCAARCNFFAGCQPGSFTALMKLSTFTLAYLAIISKWASACRMVDSVFMAHAAIRMSVWGTVIPLRRSLKPSSHAFCQRELSVSIFPRASSRLFNR